MLESSSKKHTQFGFFFNELLKTSVEAGLSDRSKTSWWWPALKYLDIYLLSDEFAIRYGQNRNGFIKEIIDNFWTLFEIR